MSKTATPPVNPGNKSATSASATSAWTRGPPPATSSAAASGANTPNNLSNPSPQPQQGGVAKLPNGVSNNGPAASQNGSAPVAISGHSRKSSLLVGGGTDIKKSSFAFGTVDSPNTMLSSSPAAPSTTGAHLADNVKAFGSIDAEASNDAEAVKTRRISSLAPSTATSPASASGAPAKKLDMHSLFAGGAKSQAHPQPPVNQSNSAIAHDRRQSFGQSGFQMSNGVPNSPYTGSPHLRPPPVSGLPGQPRSPILNQSIGPGQYNGGMGPQVQQGFRPAGMAPPQTPVRPNGAMPRPNMMMGPNMGAYGMHPASQGQYPMMNYQPQSGFYVSGFARDNADDQGGYNPYEQQQFGMNPQWNPQQHAQGQQQSFTSPNYGGSQQPGPISPRLAQAQLPAQSPLPPSANLPNSGGASPVPTPPTRPPSLIPTHAHSASNASLASIPGTPSRPPPVSYPSHQSQAPSTPGYAQLSGGAAAFTPRRTPAAIKFSRPDGTAIDLKEAAKAVSKATPPTSGAATPELSSDAPAEAPKKKVPALPVIVRIESEEQKKQRLAEEADRDRIKKIEQQEEQERKERQERKAKEDEERKAKEATEKADKEKADAEAKAKADAESEQKKMEEAIEAEQAAALKEKERREAAAKAEATDRAEVEKVAREAREKAEEQRRALLTPTTSTPSSPLASPALVAAGLPAKPIAAINGAKRPTPLDLKSSSPAPSEDATASTSALQTARPIENLSSITYPSTMKSPNPQLNVDAEPGKFRYDRDFLMQFMSFCKEKPENLPPLEEIGLEADSSSGFGSRRGGRQSTGGTSRSVSGAHTGLGIANINRPFPGQGMGSFNMGQFGSGSLRGTTSEQRYQAGLRANTMGRSPSQGGPGMPGMAGLPTMGPSSSRSGVSRGSQRGQKRAPQDPRASISHEPAVAPLQITGNAWTRTRLGGDEEGSPAYIERKVKSLLNKLTEEKFDPISSQILEWANKSKNETDGLTLRLVIKLIFEKATDEAHWSAMYAKLCSLLLLKLDPAITDVIDDKPVSGGVLFRKYLLGRCQVDFEAGWKAREDTAVAAAAKSDEDKERLAKQKAEQDTEEGGNGEAAMLSDEYYAAQKAKRRGLGLIQLIGELYKFDMVSKGVIKTCFIKLLGNVTNPDEEDIESTCKLLSTVGRAYDQTAQDNMDLVFQRLDMLVKSDVISSRIKFMVMDVIEARKNKWQTRNKQTGVMTIAEIHQQAAQEKAAAAAQASRESISRGGSRAGHARRDGPQPGEWQSVSTGPRTLARPADFSGIGRNISSSGMPSAPTFGPSSVFARKKAGAAGNVTPPISRQPSSANMFGALADATDAAPAERRPSADAGEPTPQRKKLNLAPRTKPIPGQEGEDGEGDVEAEEDAEVSTEGAAGLSDAEVEAKIDTDMKELWGEKDAGGSRNPDDIVEYFRSLPQDRRGLLAERLYSDVFRISKPNDAKVVANGLELAREQDIVSVEILKQGLEKRMPSLDDDAIDFPTAYKAVALWIRSIDLSEEDVNALVAMIEIEGTPRITPTMKMDKALGQVDDEKAAA